MLGLLHLRFHLSGATVSCVLSAEPFFYISQDGARKEKEGKLATPSVWTSRRRAAEVLNFSPRSRDLSHGWMVPPRWEHGGWRGLMKGGTRERAH